MNTQYLIALLILIFTLVLSFMMLTLINKKVSSENPEKKSIISYISLFIFISISLCVTYAFLYDPYNQLFEFNIVELVNTLLFSALIFLFGSMKKTKSFAPAIVLIGCITTVFFIPDNYQMFGFETPFWVEKTIFLVGLFLFTLGLKYINSIDGIFSTQMAAIGLGGIGLGTIIASPLIFSLGAVLFSSYLSLLFYNRYPAKIKISDAGAMSSAFLIGWFLIKISEEISISCALLLILFSLFEILIAICLKLTFTEKYSNIYNNTFCSQAYNTGLDPQTIRISATKAMVLCILLSCFQTFAPNLYSVPIFGSFAIIWFLFKMKDWQSYNKSFSEMNKDTIEQIKNNFDDIKKYISKD